MDESLFEKLSTLIDEERQEKLTMLWDASLSWAGLALKYGMLPLIAYLGLKSAEGMPGPNGLPMEVSYVDLLLPSVTLAEAAQGGM
jgi:hypothetical protein